MTAAVEWRYECLSRAFDLAAYIGGGMIGNTHRRSISKMFDRKAHVSLDALGVARKIARLPIIKIKPVAAKSAAR